MLCFLNVYALYCFKPNFGGILSICLIGLHLAMNFPLNMSNRSIPCKQKVYQLVAMHFF